SLKPGARPLRKRILSGRSSSTFTEPPCFSIRAAFQDSTFGLKALTFFLSYPLPEKAAICHLLLARAGLQAGDFRGADRHCCQALEQLRILDAPMLIYQAHVAVGQLHEYERNLEAARDSYRAARLDLERLRSSLHGEELQIAFMKNRQEVYERLIRLCLGHSSNPDAAEEAFAYGGGGFCLY